MKYGESNRKGTPVKGDCCPSAFGYVTDKALMIYGWHDRALHVLPLTPADLRKLADEIESGRARMGASERAA